ncbi:hypothetical protein CH063_14771 [Colletotrichum higginsianum]|uniref:Uncharacterized protein n=1 Tax=Colletotrichum higginsianum (strain IMI 349063) TaxID=759273 RepID=H1W008_COLHI|nr:hypothetical protein CH063_14771 [Colletotrichum higginsianum]
MVSGIPAADWSGGRESTQGRTLTHKTPSIPPPSFPLPSPPPPHPSWFLQSHQRIPSPNSKPPPYSSVSITSMPAEVHQTPPDSSSTSHHHCVASSSRDY